MYKRFQRYSCLLFFAGMLHACGGSVSPTDYEPDITGDTDPDGDGKTDPDQDDQTATDFEIDDNAQYTVSYRNATPVPADNAQLDFAEFREQLDRFDPLKTMRCPLSRQSKEYAKLVDKLGGVPWTNPVAILKDQSRPRLYHGKRTYNAKLERTNIAADSSPAPTIQRPDLVGYRDGTAIFLSKTHGLISVNTTTKPIPEVSCFLKLPGRPINFFLKGNQLVLLIDSIQNRTHRPQNRKLGFHQMSALVRFRIESDSFAYVDHVLLENQEILDARLFNNTLTIYSAEYAPLDPQPHPPTTNPQPRVAQSSSAALISPPIVHRGPLLRMKLTAITWERDHKLDIDWHEDFDNTPRGSDVLLGLDAKNIADTHERGDVIRTYNTYHRFISASDRYIVVSQNSQDVIFTGTRTRHYNVCTDYNPRYRKVTSCYPKYERVKNPDYKEPDGVDSYSCEGAKLIDCLADAVPQLSQYIYRRNGETCNTYWRGQCEAWERRMVRYPTFRYQDNTRFIVFRYDGGEFIKLDSTMRELVLPDKRDQASTLPPKHDKPDGTNIPLEGECKHHPNTPTETRKLGASSDLKVESSLRFVPRRDLEVPGRIQDKNDLRFQHGRFYVITDGGDHIHTLVIAKNSIAYLHGISVPRGLYGVDASALFADDRLMVSSSYFNQDRRTTWSIVNMLSLPRESFPELVTTCNMPGKSDQLLLATAGILGPGTVSFSHERVRRNLQKLTLFSARDAQELDNLLLGTELDSNFSSSWFGSGGDDQRIRLDSSSQTLFLPYSGREHASTTYASQHRLNITYVNPETRTLEVENSFTLAEAIVRTVSILPAARTTNSDRALAFGNSSVYALDRNETGWKLQTIKEVATPIAIYRLSDTNNLRARIHRIGSKCTMSTHKNAAKKKTETTIETSGFVACPEYGLPVGIENAVVFPSVKTGWQIDRKSGSITELTPKEVDDFVAKIRRDVYCMLNADEDNNAPVESLDTVPTKPIQCAPVSTISRKSTGVP